MADASSDSTDADAFDAAEADAAASASPAARWGQRIGAVVGGLGLVLAAAFLVLQTETGATATARLLADQFNPLPGTTLSIERAGGTWLGSLRLEGVRLTRPDSASGGAVEMAAIDTLAVRYQLLPLLRSRLHVERVAVNGPSLSLRQDADSTWDWARVLPPASDEPSRSSVRVEVDEIDVRRGAVAASFFAPNADSTARLFDVRLAAHRLRVGPEISVRLDTLGLAGRVPGDTTDLHLSARGALRPAALRIDTLRLDSPRSHVRAGGSARLPRSPADSLDDVALRLRADPLSFRDVQALLPPLAVDPSESVVLDAEVTGSERRLEARLAAQFRGRGRPERNQPERNRSERNRSERDRPDRPSAARSSPNRTPPNRTPPDRPVQDRGRVSLTASFTPRTTASPTSGPLRYRVDASVEAVTTRLLGLPTDDGPRLTARLEADLRGPRLGRLTGPVRLRVDDTRVGGLRADSLTVDASFREGAAALQAGGAVNGAAVQLTGKARPLDAVPSYRADLRLRDVDLQQIFGAAAPSSQMAGTVRLSGTGLEAADRRLDASLQLGPSRIGRQALSSAEAQARVRPDSAAFSTSVAFPEGGLSATGGVDLFPPYAFTVDTLRARSVNVAALTGDTTASALTASAHLTGRGRSAESLRLGVDVRLDEGRYGSYRAAGGHLNGELRNGRFEGRVETILNGGRWSLTLESRPFAQPLTARVRNGRFAGVDLGAFTSPPPDAGGGRSGTDGGRRMAPTSDSSATATDLSGTFQASVQGADPFAMPSTADASVTATLRPSRIQRQPVESARLEAVFSGGRLTARAALSVPGGGVDLAVEGRPFDPVPSFRISQGRFEALDLGALAGLPGQRTSLSGSLSATLQGTTWNRARGRLRLDVEPSAINRATVSDGRLLVTADSGRADVDARLRTEQSGSMQMTGFAQDLNRAPTYRLTGSAGGLDAGALAGLDAERPVRADTLQWTLDGRGVDPSTLRASATVASGPLQVDRFELSGGRLEGRLRSGILQLDTLSVRSNAVDAAGRGQVAFADTTVRSDFDLVVAVADARPLERLIGLQQFRLTRGRAELHVYGPPGTLRFNGTSTIRRLRSGDLRLSNLDLRFNGAGSLQTGIQQADLRGTLGLFSSPAVVAEDTEVTIGYTPDEIDVQTRLRLDRRRRATLSARLRPHLDASRLTLQSLSARLGANRWQLLQPAEFSYAGPYRLERFLLSSGNQQIAADGRIDPTGRQSFIATVEQVRLDPLAGLFGFPGLGGEVSGSARLSGPADAPRLDGRLDAALTSEGTSVGTLQLDLGYDSLSVSVDAALEHVDGQRLTARGRLPADLRLKRSPPVDTGDRPVSLAVAADGFPIDWIDPFVDPETVRDIGGVLQSDVQIAGTLDDPDLSGTASVREGQAFLPDLGVAYRGARARIAFDGEQARVRDAVVRTTNGGRLEADGTVAFSDLTLGRFDLSLEARTFIGIDTRAYRSAVLDGAFTLRGTTERPVLDGTAEVRRADVFYTEALAQTASELATVSLSSEDRLVLEERFGLRLTAADTTTFDAYEALTMDLSVEIQGDTWLRSDGTPELDVQFRGDLDVSKQAMQDAQVFGTIEVVTARSTVQQFGQEFQITEGTLTFNGDPTLPYLDLAAVYEPRSQGTTNEPSVEITLSLEGRPDELTPQLTSDPPMYTRDILSYLATGRPADQVLGGGGNGGLTANVPRGLAAGFAEDFAANRLGLDVVRFAYSAEGDWYLTVGQYLTPRLYVAVEQSVGSGFADRNALELVPDLTLEYQVTPYMQLRTVRRQSSLRFNVFLEYAY